jgi:CBS-domain-containing membrane protein
VADFLGKDRVLRALVVIPVTEAMTVAASDGPRLSSESSAHDALSLMLREGAESVTIINEAGDALGSVTWTSLINAALVVQEE